ncbi:MAG: metallophosphoesterase [Acidimicrobiia bacterium]
MRILLVSDLHYVLRQFDWVVEQLAQHDMVVLAGDQLDIASAVPLDAQIAVLQALIARVDHPERLVVSSGNHDLTGPDDHGEQAALWFDPLRAAGVTVDGDSRIIGDALVTACPWWDGAVGKARLAEQFARDSDRSTRPWVWVYHWPPDQSPTCWTGKRHYGDPDLRAWITEYQPDLVLTGHVHNPPFRPDGAWADRIGNTWIFNAGNQLGPEPAHVTIDLDANEAVWRSLLGQEVQPLDGEPITERPSF